MLASTLKWPWHQVESETPQFRWTGEMEISLDIELLFRPYALLELGDQLTGQGGRSWRFEGPWRWCSDDSNAGHELVGR